MTIFLRDDPVPARPVLGIIGGSGLYGLPLEHPERHTVDTQWGSPSDALLHGRLGETDLVFLPRHGRGHTIAPSDLNYRANIAALKAAGCTAIVSLSACGSFREELPPGSFVVIDQLVDRTRGRANSFFGDGIVAHVSLADPFCASLGDAIVAAAPDCIRGGTYLAMEGPQFSTRAESCLYRAAGLDVIGMTAAPEAALAREAELCYATVAMVTDYDSWREGEAVDVAVLAANAARAAALVAGVAAGWSGFACNHGCSHALDHAVITDRAKWPPATVDRLSGIAGRVLSS
ncbi:MAG: 5'-methylthioadenosine phosphorylase [Janthinobacterium lividum]